MDQFLYVKLALQADKNADTLLENYGQKLRRRIRRGISTSKTTPLLDALWDGFCSLKQDAVAKTTLAKNRGQLLFCHAGTTILTTAQTGEVAA
jgi:hypothetical protein